MTHLFTKNKKVNSHNMVSFDYASFSNKGIITAIDTVSGDVSDDIKQTIIEKVPV